MTELNKVQTIDLWSQCRNANWGYDGAETWNRAIKDRSISSVSFQGHQFHRDANFADYHFPTADFSEATFLGEASFNNATFEGKANFDDATLKQTVSFLRTTFEQNVSFQNTAFEQYAQFSTAYSDIMGNLSKHGTPSGKIGYNPATFLGEVNFDGASFKQAIIFSETTFSGVTSFAQTIFSGMASFDSATFKQDASFFRTTFSSKADFHQATFSGNTGFVLTAFHKDVSLKLTTFSDKASFAYAIFGQETQDTANFENTTFGQDVSFTNTTFSGETDFKDVTFSGGVDFGAATFGQRVRFLRTTCTGKADFRGAGFKQEAYFLRATFSDMANFSTASFGQEAHFLRAQFKGDVDFSGIEASKAFAFSLHGCCFDGPLSLSSPQPLGCVLDLTEVKNAHPISLEAIRCNLRRHLPKWLAWAKKIPLLPCLLTSLQIPMNYTDRKLRRDLQKRKQEDIDKEQALPLEKKGSGRKSRPSLKQWVQIYRRMQQPLLSAKDDRDSEGLRKDEKLAREDKDYAQALQLATDGRDSERLRVLKKLAHDNKDHAKALEYRVLEFQANRWSSLPHQHSSWWLQALRGISEFFFLGLERLRPLAGAATSVVGCPSVWDGLPVRQSIAQFRRKSVDGTGLFSGADLYLGARCSEATPGCVQ
ncbi:MAG: pentapeptide repeat-containing protein, partial [Gammaproteobacteria bacterium]